MSSGEALRSTPSVSYGSFTAASTRKNIRRACRWLDRETARVGQASFVAQPFILIESGAIALARSIVGVGRSQIRGAHRDVNVRFGSKADIRRERASISPGV